MIVLDNRPGYATSMEVPEGTKLVLYLHNDLLNSETRDAQTIYRKADRILTVSDYIAGRVRTIDPHDRKCIAVLNGIDRKAFAPGTDDDRREGRRKMGFADEDFVMVFSGRMAKEKGIGELIEAMGALADRPDIKLLVVGSPFYGDTADEDDFVRELKRKAQAVEGRIRFTGFVGYAQMPAYLRMADIAVVPSLWDDPCPNTVLEAQATGLPLITTRRGGIPEEVTEEGAVMLDTDERFTERLTEAIVALHDDPERRRRMATAQLQHAAYYTTERYTEDFFRAIEKPFTD
jgi:glycosyltransferase involved in cell wall biosynthesis